jgi:hypothetical protein
VRALYRDASEVAVILAIDPGSALSAYVLFNGERVVAYGKVSNEDLRDLLLRASDSGGPLGIAEHLVIELAESFGAKVWSQVFTTTFWAGRFAQAWGHAFSTLGRRAVKLNLLGASRGKDGQIRQVLIDRWGGKDKALGSKSSPGPLRGLTADCWQALALAVTYSDAQSQTCGKSQATHSQVAS